MIDDQENASNNGQAAHAEAPTVPLTPKVDASTIPIGEVEAEKLVGPLLDVGYAQSVGRQRDHNEDALLAINTALSTSGGLTSFGLFIVADGMGGHKQGEVASELAVRTMASQITQKLMLARIAPQPVPPKESIQEIMDHSVQEAHRLITKEAPGSGTTMTALLLLDKHITIAHIGDSRAYIVHPNGDLQTLTRDHSLVMRMMELGQLTEEEAAVHPQRNVLYRALGQGEAFAPDITTSPQPESGYLMLCSDGLWGVLPRETIAHIITENTSPQVASWKLVDAANEAGGPDNITVILIQLPG
jgi:protein phosphatase